MKRSQPLVTIVIPVYNDQNLLSKTLASIAKQTYKNVEVYVVDDGSETPVSVDLSVFNFPISIIRQKNGGAPSARNAGLKKAKGEYVLFLDDDVRLERTMISSLVEVLESHPEYAFAYGDYYFGDVLMKGAKQDIDRLIKANYINTMSLVRTSQARTWNESLKRFQDWHYFLGMTLEGKKGYYFPQTLFTITPKKNGISTWLPRYAYWFPFSVFPKYRKLVKAYEAAQHKMIQAIKEEFFEQHSCDEEECTHEKKPH